MRERHSGGPKLMIMFIFKDLLGEQEFCCITVFYTLCVFCKYSFFTYLMPIQPIFSKNLSHLIATAVNCIMFFKRNKQI